MSLPIDYITIHKDEVTQEMLDEVGESPKVIEYADGTDTVFSFWEFQGTYPKTLEDAGYHKIDYIELRAFKAGVLDGSITHSRGGLDDGSGKDHHASYEEILENETVCVESRKQMVVFGGLDLGGTITLNGTLILRK